MKKTIGLLLFFVAYGMLYPGLTQPILGLTGTVEKSDLVILGKNIIVDNPDTPELIGTMAEVLVANMEVSGTVEAYHKTRSILGTVQELYRDNYKLVAFLVALFSIIIPIFKGLMLLASQLRISDALAYRLKTISSLVSKWSMADVFVVGIFVAYLAANAIKKEGGLLSFEAVLGPGFYFFLGYCLLSIVSSQLLAEKNTLQSYR